MDVFLSHVKKINGLNSHALFKPGTVTCVYGKPGIGKTYMVLQELPHHVIVDHTVLKSRHSTNEFFVRLKDSKIAVIIDDWESICDLVGVNEIKGPISSGPMVIISHTPVKLTPDTIMFEKPLLTREQLIKLAPDSRPDIDTLVDACQGDVRAFLQSFVHVSDSRDTFKTSREIVSDLVTCKNPVKYLEQTLHEHGYVWNMIQENYVDTKGIDMATCADISDALSMGDIYDRKIYADGVWDSLMPYFITEGCIVPCQLMKQKLNDTKLRAGSMWTKFQNACMRRKKIRETKLERSELQVIRSMVERGDYTMLDEYKLDSASIDVMNHIVIDQKLKPKIVENAKKYVRARDAS
jgi:hypothetical protein